ncbi:hypothetical protein FNV43_RR21217 [Rhamnella rubrinervis]|uniref:ACT domain-containing protein ACR n=1 Tax=Rhamnella rubrinervis TaxID=2594499 RepID=A0A8K0DW95_9ROSA|nr:hypothetical protein FNV43_RR21217 [Rhamnella rubrinervis]
MFDNSKGNSSLDPILLSDSDEGTILEIEDKDIIYEEHWDMEQRQIVKEFLCGKRKAIAADEGNCTSIQYATLEEHKQYEEARKRQKEETLKAFLNKDIEDLAPFSDISDISSSDFPMKNVNKKLKFMKIMKWPRSCKKEKDLPFASKVVVKPLELEVLMSVYMQYSVFHGTVITGRREAYQEYYIRHIDGLPQRSEAERQRVLECLEAATERRATEGLELELCTTNKHGLLSDATRIFRENSLYIRRAEISTNGGKVKDTFLVNDVSGNNVEPKVVVLVREQIGQSILQVKDQLGMSQKRPQQEGARSFLFVNFFKGRSF